VGWQRKFCERLAHKHGVDPRAPAASGADAFCAAMATVGAAREERAAGAGGTPAPGAAAGEVHALRVYLREV
jgi:hypothetical protein